MKAISTRPFCQHCEHYHYSCESCAQVHYQIQEHPFRSWLPMISVISVYFVIAVGCFWAAFS